MSKTSGVSPSPALVYRALDPTTLRYFVSICEEGSLARAAEREALVPSALSKRVAALEAALGLPLLLRRRRGVVPTAAGEALLTRAREVLGAVERTTIELGALAQGVQGSVRVVASPSMLAQALPEDIGQFLALHPALRVALEEASIHDIARRVREGSADVGILWDQAELAGLSALAYRVDHLCMAMPAHHPLATRRHLRYVDTLAYDSVGIAAGGLLDRLLRREAALAGVMHAHRVQVSSVDVACRIVAAGLGLALIPREVAQAYGGPAPLVLVPLTDRWAKRKFVAVLRPPPDASPAATLLAQHLHRSAKQARPRSLY